MSEDTKDGEAQVTHVYDEPAADEADEADEDESLLSPMATAAAALSYALETGAAQHAEHAQALYAAALEGATRPEVEQVVVPPSESPVVPS